MQFPVGANLLASGLDALCLTRRLANKFAPTDDLHRLYYNGNAI
jgi:hypothetical protein